MELLGNSSLDGVRGRHVLRSLFTKKKNLTGENIMRWGLIFGLDSTLKSFGVAQRTTYLRTDLSRLTHSAFADVCYICKKST